MTAGLQAALQETFPWYRAGRLFQALPEREWECWSLPAGALGHSPKPGPGPLHLHLQPRSAVGGVRLNYLWNWNWIGLGLDLESGWERDGTGFHPKSSIIHCGGTHCCDDSKNSRGGREGAGPPLIE